MRDTLTIPPWLIDASTMSRSFGDWDQNPTTCPNLPFKASSTSTSALYTYPTIHLSTPLVTQVTVIVFTSCNRPDGLKSKLVCKQKIIIKTFFCLTFFLFDHFKSDKRVQLQGSATDAIVLTSRTKACCAYPMDRYNDTQWMLDHCRFQFL